MAGKYILLPDFMISWILKRLPDKKAMSSKWWGKMLGQTILQPRLWHISRRSLAGGLALGIFIAFTPTLGAHFILACLGSLVFRVNLPAAVVATFVMNPVTIPPFYYICFKLGDYLVHLLPEYHYPDVTDPVSFGKGVWHKYKILWVGSLVMASFAACFTYVVTMVLYGMDIRSKRRKKLQARKTQTNIPKI
jgi:uncharacterized protein